ncbi:MAG TPA: thioesterase family protein [Kofleriaceae bacterium]|nr:thioesterase family protein [Kofleriaceae bacterium]
MASLYDVTTPTGDGTLLVREGWRQGRGAYGGLTIAAAIRAIEQRVADPRRKVRTVTAEIPGPTLPGEAAFSVDVLRSGNSVTVARAALSQAGEVTTHAVAVLAASRPVPDPPTWRDVARPASPPWQDIDPIPRGGPFPEFAQHFEYRIVSGAAGSGGTAQTIGWVRPREPGASRDAAYIAALIDAWWPAMLVRTGAMRPLGTIAYTLELVDDLVETSDAPLLYRGTVPIAGDGYFLETRELWTDDGRLLALNHQTFVVIR